MLDKKGVALFLITETPLHAGSGSELGVVDLPIQRERYTGWPKVEASSFKGALREYFDGEDNEKEIIFGPEGGDLHAGAVSLTDVRLLLFPVRSGKGTFAWIISPDAYSRFRKDMEILRRTNENISIENLPEFLSPNTVSNDSQNVLEIDRRNMVLLEEYSFEVRKGDANLEEFVNWLESALGDEIRKNEIKRRICVVDNDFFNDMVQMYTEIITRIRIDRETKTVSGTGLWNEEYLPADTIMYSMVFASKPMVKDMNSVPENLKTAEGVLNRFLSGIPQHLFLGGNTTVGKGLVRIESFGKEEG